MLTNVPARLYRHCWMAGWPGRSLWLHHENLQGRSQVKDAHVTLLFSYFSRPRVQVQLESPRFYPGGRRDRTLAGLVCTASGDYSAIHPRIRGASLRASIFREPAQSRNHPGGVCALSLIVSPLTDPSQGSCG